MAEITADSSSGGGFGKVLIWIVLLSIILAAAMTLPHALRHSASVQNIPSKCNESLNAQIHMRNPATGRDAFGCFVEGFWVVTIKNFDPVQIAKHGDDTVTSFPIESAKNLQDVID